jgi:hypothetical protein
MATVTGGNKFNQILADMAKQVSSAQAVRVGWLEGAVYPSGVPVALVAAMDEFGVPSRGQPPRPAFRNMIAAKQGEWPKAIADLLKTNNYDAKITLQQTGEAVARQLRQSIIEITEPPLKPSTIKRKGFDKPWIETGFLLSKVDYEVKT